MKSFSLLCLSLLSLSAFSGDNCSVLNQAPCSVDCSGCGSNHAYTVSCTYYPNFTCVNGGGTSAAYTLQVLPASITIYHGGDCQSSSNTYNVTQLPYTFSYGDVSPGSINTIPVNLTISGHYCSSPGVTVSCTCGD